MAQNQNLDASAWLLEVPPTVLQIRLALGLVAAASVAFVAIIPVSGRPLLELNAFFPSLDAVVCITDLITAVLLFAQFSISAARPLLVLAAGYLFTALIVVPHALTFEGAFSPTGLLGAGIQTGSWLFIFWHFGFSLSLLVYAMLRSGKATRSMPTAMVSTAIVCTVVALVVLVCVLTWIATAGQALLPPIILDDRRISPIVVYPIMLTIAVCALALVLLWLRRQRSTLDHWLMVVALVAIGELALSGLLPSVRFSAGFYAGRFYSLFVSSVVLIVLLEETTRLYAQVLRSNALLQRERDNKLMNMEAMTAAIAHEVRQPLTTISTLGQVALSWLKRTPVDLEEVRTAVHDIIAASHRANTVFDNIRALFGKELPVVHLLNLNRLIIHVVRTMDAEFKQHGIEIETDLAWRLPSIRGHGGQLQEVVSNLLNNAIEALDSVDGPRVVKVTTRLIGLESVTVAVQDTGRGLDPEKANSIFEPFVTTKKRGMGLGLAICSMIILRHQGQLSATPANGRGTIFTFTLPQVQLDQ